MAKKGIKIEIKKRTAHIIMYIIHNIQKMNQVFYSFLSYQHMHFQHV